MNELTAASGASPTPALLAKITAELAAGEDLRALLERFLAPVMQVAQARAGAVRMLSADGARLELVGALGLPASLCDAEQLADRHCGFCGEGVDQVRVVWTHELRPCALRTGDAFFAAPGRSALAVPLRHGERVLGIYNLFFDDEREPEPAALLLLRSVGELLGLALEKHRLEAENLRATVAQERQRMAADLHDAVAQNLTFVKMRLPLLHDAIQACKRESALALLEEVRETLGEAHASLREIVTHFRTGVDPRGLAAALATLAARFTVRTGIPLQVDNRLPALQLAEQAQAEVFHIVQEALANVERHAAARHGWLVIEPGLGRVEIRIEDDGVGTGAASSEGAPAATHYGLAIMRERAQRLGGLLAVAPRPGGGTMVRCSLPLPVPSGESP